MGGKRNRNAGIRYEQQICREINDLGFRAVTSRYESRSTDDRGIDIISDFPLAVQCKTSVSSPNFHKLLSETEAEIVFWRKTEKRGARFMEAGEYVTMKKSDFYKKFI